MHLDVSSLRRAIEQLAAGLAYLHSPSAGADPGLATQLRAAVIKEFEYTYELCHKMVRRQLELDDPSPDAIRELPFLDLMRTAADHGLVSDPRAFRAYREKRNITSHVYDADKAEEVLSVVGAFLADARFILAALEKHNHGA